MQHARAEARASAEPAGIFRAKSSWPIRKYFFQHRCNKPNNPHWEITGDYCECDNYSCPGGSTCSGHGRCVCGGCVCDIGWTGNSCECSTETHACRMETGELCSARGDCVCGQCQCHAIASAGKYYTGKFCERCTVRMHLTDCEWMKIPSLIQFFLCD